MDSSEKCHKYFAIKKISMIIILILKFLFIFPKVMCTSFRGNIPVILNRIYRKQTKRKSFYWSPVIQLSIIFFRIVFHVSVRYLYFLVADDITKKTNKMCANIQSVIRLENGEESNRWIQGVPWCKWSLHLFNTHG